MGESQSGLSNIYRYLKKNHIDISQVAFDKEMESGNVQFLSPFWTGELSIYLNAEDVVKKPVAMIPSYFISCASKLAINNKLFSAYGCTIYDTSRNKTRKSNNR
jgi:hypothetical protein